MQWRNQSWAEPVNQPNWLRAIYSAEAWQTCEAALFDHRERALMMTSALIADLSQDYSANKVVGEEVERVLLPECKL